MTTIQGSIEQEKRLMNAQNTNQLTVTPAPTLKQRCVDVYFAHIVDLA